MEEQKDADGSEKGPQDDVLSGLIKAFINKQVEETVKQQRETYPPKKSWRRSWRAASPLTKASLILATVVAAATIGYTIVAWRTLNVMRQISTDSGAQTDKLIDAANQIKAAAWQFKGSAQSIDGNLGSAVGKLQLQAENFARSKESAERSSEKSLRATIDSFHRDQRAWISVEPATGIPTTSTFKIAIPVNNTGRTPARAVIIYYNGKVVPQSAKFTYTFEGTPVPFGYLAPGKPSSTFIYNGDQNKNRIAIKGPDDYYVVFGAITYEDVFEMRHWLTYCFFNFEGQGYSYCPEHNQIGDGPLPEAELR